MLLATRMPALFFLPSAFFKTMHKLVQSQMHIENARCIQSVSRMLTFFSFALKQAVLLNNMQIKTISLEPFFNPLPPFSLAGEWLQNRAQPFQCNPVPCCSLLSGDGQGPGWTFECMWQVNVSLHDAKTFFILKRHGCFSVFLFTRLCVCVCVLYSSAMLEESQDDMDSGTLSPASARQVTIQRHPTQGFGFIAGSQRPVIVRSVSAG